MKCGHIIPLFKHIMYGTLIGGVRDMTGKVRHYFPGNNTPEGFFSYYDYILKQWEADKIWCIKGGPGVGKSTFMRKIGETMLNEGHDVDFLHCSSDSDSLDGIVLRDKKIAMVDGTRPHIVDPINPGAVDTIINLGEFWNEMEIRKNRITLINTNEQLKSIFSYAYNYLAAAEKMYDNVSKAEAQRIKNVELYKIAAWIIGKELGHKELGLEPGQQKRFFASAITPTGLVNYIEGLTQGYQKVYLLHSSIGSGCEKVLELLLESALFRGFDCEVYYCPMKPRTKIEHLLIPKLSIAVVTSNCYHRVLSGNCGGAVVEIDLEALSTEDVSSFQTDVVKDSIEKMNGLIQRAVNCLAIAKKEHDTLENYYIPNMDFNSIEDLRKQIENQIRER